MSSRTPRPEDEYPPLDTDDGDRYIPTSRELADQYRRERSARDGGADDPITAGPAGDPAGDPGAGDTAGQPRTGVRVTEPVPLVPDEPSEATAHPDHESRPVDAADRAVPTGDAGDAPGAVDAADGGRLDPAEGWRERFDHAAAMDAWDREFDDEPRTGPAASGQAADARQDGATDDDGDAPHLDAGTSDPDAEQRARSEEGPRVGTGITETDARSDAGRAAAGATTIDRRSAATHADPAGDVPAPLGSSAVAAGHPGAGDGLDEHGRDEHGRDDDGRDDEGTRDGGTDGALDAGAGPARADKHRWVSADGAEDPADDRTDRNADTDTDSDRVARADRDPAAHADRDDRDRDVVAPTGTTGSGVAVGAAAAGATVAGAGAAGRLGRDQDRDRDDERRGVRPEDERDPDLPERPVEDEGRQANAAGAAEDDEEARRRATRRDAALEGKPAAGRFWQVVLAIAFPVVLLAAAVRAVASPLFLWIEYHRPGFPADPYGFTADDRLTWGSAVEDYINNFANPRYLTQIPGKDGGSLLTEGEISHMVDVKNVIGVSWIVAAVLFVLGLIAVVYLAKRYLGGVRRGLFVGSLITLAVVIALGVFALIDWSLFFTTFHRVFFAQGNWTFYENDALIRLFPAQFWVDSGIVIGGLVVVVSLVTLIMTWPTRRRRARSRAAQEALRRSMADHEEVTAG
ncbi:hypothetical protein GCM10011512_19840 [Tersicoccus solisilvae]|uniref:TIGR01906 family membrane protein n=1 Tax=Tersicoccus solisilvae TaxID=1882339 RepID=A0ABQ1P896_9MICC|nr:TIGR01906 family membrane protein [Tersicoccus solisilvae]GGC92795.1 hypothetical protein GCM10011512_19840 [Tersicoccus solisilvae]